MSCKGNRVSEGYFHRHLMSMFAALFFMLLGLTAPMTSHAADVNVLIIGSTLSSDLYYPSPKTPFNPTEVKTELEKILGGAGLGTVNVTLENREGRNLATWFYYPYSATDDVTRWSNLRGQNGTQWDYVVLIEDPFTIEGAPGWFCQGVASIAEEVAKGTAKTVVLMNWPGASTTSTLAHYKEMVYRSANTTGCKVAPAGLAWQAAGSPTGGTHPTSDGAYIAAASIYSSIWEKNANISNYKYSNTNLANTVYTTVTNNIGVQQYTGVYNDNGISKFLNDKSRKWCVGSVGTKSSDYMTVDCLQDVLIANRMLQTEDTRAGYPRAVWLSCWGYRSGSYLLDFDFEWPSNDNDRTADDFISDIGWDFLSYLDAAKVPYPFTSNYRYKPISLIWAQYSKAHPSAKPIIGMHYSYDGRMSSGAFMYTMFSGRCPLSPKPNPVTTTWTATKVGYETAWRLGRMQGRAPGFRTLPSNAFKLKIAPGQTETMTAQFVLPLKSNVTVNVSVSNPNVATVSPSQLTFTPGNQTIDQQVVVTGLGNADPSSLIRVNFNTVSTDEVCNGLYESWDYDRNFSPVITDAPWVDVNPITLPSMAWVNVTASDPEGDALTYTWSKVSGPGTATFSPNEASNSRRSQVTFSKPGTYVLKSIVSDGISSSDGGEVTVQVLNAVPVANAQTVTAFQNSPNPITLTASDANGDALTYVVWDDPVHGTLTGSGSNLFYTSESGYLGSDSFTFLVNDGYGNSSPATVTITVNAPNTPPVVDAGTNQTVVMVLPPVSTDWSFAPWTGDADSGISSSYSYTAAHSFGNNRASATVNGVTFTESFATSGTGWSIGGAVVNWEGDDDAAVSGNSELLAQEFVFNGNPRTVTFTGLTVGQTYEASFFSVAWETGLRVSTFSTPGVTSADINQDQYGDNNGIRISCSYTATATSQTVTIGPGFHMCAMANRVVQPTVSVNLAGSASDVDGDSLTKTWSRTSGPGSVVFGNASALTTTAMFTQTGTYLLRLTVADAYSQVFDELTVTVTDISGNSAPSAANASISTGENIAKAVTLSATDAQNDVLTYTIVTSPAHGTLSGTAPNLTYTPTAGYSGSDSISFKVNDGFYDSVVATVSITVIPNLAPVIVVDSPTSNLVYLAPYGGVMVETTVTDDGYPVNPGAVTLGWSKVSGPGTVTFESPNQADTVIKFGASGTYVVRLTVSDGAKQTTRDVTLLFGIDQTGATNNGPQVNAILKNISGAPGIPVPLDITVLFVEDDGNPFGTLTTQWKMVSGPGAGAFADPAAKFTTFVCNTPGTYILRITGDDGQVKAYDDVTLTVSGTGNAMPVATAQSVTVTEDTPKAITLSGSDGNSNPLTYAIVTQPSHGTLSGTAPSVIYTPAANYNGSDSFTFKVNDGITDSLTSATVSITVTPVNDAPVANAMNVTTAEDMRLPISLSGNDVDGDDLIFSIVSQPAHGTMSGSGSGVKYTPVANYNGNDSFTFRVTDPSGLYSQAVVSITVTPTEDVPVANPQSVLAVQNTPKLIVLNGTDADNDPLTYSIFDQPLHGTLDISNLPNVTYTPDANYFGADFFRFTVNDGKANSIVATVNITVQPVGLSSVDSIRGASQNGPTYPLGYYANANDGTVGGIGSIGSRTVTDVVLGHGLPILPTGAVITGATLNFEVALINAMDSRKLSVYLLDTVNPDSSGTTFFYDGPINTTATAKHINDFTAVGAKQTALPQAAVELLRSYYGSDHMPDRMEAFFRFNLNAALSAGSLLRYSLNTGVSQNSLSIQYAIATDIVTYHSNDSTSGTAPISQYKLDGVNLFLQGPESLVKTGHVFAGWNTAANGSGTNYAVGATYTTDGDATLYAQWRINSSPVANAQSVAAFEDTAKAITLTGSDVDGYPLVFSDVGSYPLTYTILTQPANGTLSGTAPNVTYTPAANYNGSDSFTFRVSDPLGASGQATVSITVASVNDIPVVNAQSVTTPEDTAKAITLTGSDVDGNPLTYIVVNQPVNGTLSGTAPNVTYSPAANYYGSDSFTFKINDGTADSAVATVSITITGVNDTLPVVNAGPDQVLLAPPAVLWTPAAIACEAWFDAADTTKVLRSGSVVTSWLDKSGNGRNATQGTAANQPAYVTGSLNGLNTVDFDGANDQLNIGGTAFPLRNVFVVFNWENAYAPGGKYVLNNNAIYANGGNYVSSYLPISANPAIYIDGTYKGIQQADFSPLATCKLFEVIAGANTTSNSNWMIGGSGQSGNYWDGKMAEIILTSGELSTSDRERIEGYLAHKWGFQGNLPANHPYKYGAPVNPVAVANLQGTASDADGDPLTTTWSVVSPTNAVVSFGNAAIPSTTATLYNIPQTYVLRLTANDGFGPVSDDVAITVSPGTPAPTVAWTAASQASANESGTLTVTAQLSAASASTVTVPFTVTGTATGADRTISATPITIAAGATTGTATITITADTLDELNETVILTMGVPTNATFGATTVHTATITDDDNIAPAVNAGSDQTVNMVLPPVSTDWSFAPWTGDADSGISSGSTYTAAHSFGNNRASATVNGVTFTESFATSGTGWSIGGAVVNWEGDDDAAVSGNSEFLAQEFIFNGNPRTVTFTGLTVGQIYEASFFSVAWETGLRVSTFSTPGVTSADINQDQYGDNQGIRISCSYTATATSQTVTIGPGFHLCAMANRLVQPTVSVSLDGTVSDASGDPLTTAWSLVSGPGSVTFGNASAVDTTATLTVAGTYTLRLTANDGYGPVSDDVVITVTSGGVSSPSVAWTATNQTSANESGTLTVTAQLSAASASTVTVPFTVTGTATGSDYTISATPITIAAGATTGTATITITADTIDEPNETVILTMGTPTNATAGATTVHTATITDDDVAPTPTVAWTAASQSSAGESGTMTVTAQLSATSVSSVSVPFTVTGTASGADYTISSSPITIAAGATTGTATITITADTIDEPNETVILTMGTPTNATAGATIVHTATITDDDVAPTPTVAWTAASQSSAGESGTLTVTAQLSAALASPVTVPFTVTGTATGGDYTITSSPITIAAGATTGTATITITADTIDEPNETVILTVGTPTNATAGATTVHTATITDDDNTAPTVNAGPDQTVALSSPPVPGWSFAPWTGDADSGISSGSTYTAKHSFGNNRTSAVVNGVTFTEGNVTSGTGWSIGGTANFSDGNDDAAVTGNSELLAQEFVFNANPRTVTFSGLTVGKTYEAVLYSVAWETGSRSQIFSTPGVTSSTINQDQYGDNNGIRIACVYTASATTQTLTITPETASTFHLYAMANREVSLTVATVSLDGTVSDPNGDTLTTTWSVVSGPAPVTIGNASAVDTTATFSAAGTYTFRLTANDSYGPVSDDVVITVTSGGGSSPTVAWTAASQSSAGESGTLTVTAQLSATSVSSVSVPFTVTGTATGADYTITATPITIAAGATTGTATITITSDTIDEPNETVILTMGTPTNATAGATTVHTATITNDDVNTPPVVNAGPDQTVQLVYTPPTAGWSFAPWTGDADSGISTSSVYTAKHSFGNNRASATVNGVTFTESFATSGTGWSIGGAVANGEGNDNAAVSGNSELLAQEFVFNGNPRTVTFTGLTVGQTYEASFFSVAFETGSRTMTFSTPGVTSADINQDQYGDNNGIRISCSYTATATSQTVTITPVPSSGTFHMYAIANRLLTPTASANLKGTASDADGDSLTTTWSVVSPTNSGVTFGNAAVTNTTATFTSVGSYVLRLTASDTFTQTVSQVTITVTTNAVVIPPARTLNGNVPTVWLAAAVPASTNDYEAAALADPDNDGYTTAQEYWSGTDPLNIDSFLKLDAVEINGVNVVLKWRHANVDAGLPPITIQARSNLVSGTWGDIGTKTPTNGINIWSSGSSVQGYYRLTVTNAP